MVNFAPPSGWMEYCFECALQSQGLIYLLIKIYICSVITGKKTNINNFFSSQRTLRFVLSLDLKKNHDTQSRGCVPWSDVTAKLSARPALETSQKKNLGGCGVIIPIISRVVIFFENGSRFFSPRPKCQVPLKHCPRTERIITTSFRTMEPTSSLTGRTQCEESARTGKQQQQQQQRPLDPCKQKPRG